MSKLVAINGFGRIGRLALRAALGNKNLKVVAINDLAKADMSAHLFKYDSVHGTFDGSVSVKDGKLRINGNSIEMFKVSDPGHLPWSKLGIDIVMECSGRFVDKKKAAAHLSSGAKKVIVSSPCKDADVTVVYGVNQKQIQSCHKVISAASCTTNCLAPIAKVLNDRFGIEKGHMTTVHAYTSDQNLIDTAHKKDFRRARAAAVNIIPTSTGAAKAIDLVIPELAGKLTGTALRVPAPNVSLIDFSFVSKQKVTSGQLNDAIKDAAGSSMKGIISVCEDEIVSSDCNHTCFSAIFDATQTSVTNGNFCRVMAWYDNEWAFVHRMIDIAEYISV
ncbi:MAG: type I glyceraldehyde-3-phosphate dehydrogenase [Holosporales bacterium]|nr:type I glyceraldehyde-3-phosphate dehydrogenase [Holosporales bacterium]